MDFAIVLSMERKVAKTKPKFDSTLVINSALFIVHLNPPTQFTGDTTMYIFPQPQEDSE